LSEVQIKFVNLHLAPVILSSKEKNWFFITCYAKNAYKIAQIPCRTRKIAFELGFLTFGTKSSLKLPKSLAIKGKSRIIVLSSA
jgi:hypothetical protein